MKCKLLIVSCIISSFVFGCSTTRHKKDGYEYQPLVKPPGKVSGILEYKPTGWIDIGKMVYDNIISWKVNDFKKYESEDIIWKSDSFLKNNNIFSWRDFSNVGGLPARYMVKPVCHKLSKSELPNNEQYPWLRHQNAFYLKRMPYTEEYVETYKDKGHKVIKTISCLEPIVVIITKGNILNFHNSIFIDYEDRKIKPEYPDTLIEVADSIALKHGYAYGTRMPHALNPQWFSPDMKIAPQSVDIDADGVGHIPVSWGELVLTKENDDWVVTAKAKE